IKDKQMKRIYNYLFLAILALTACNDDFLDRTPLDKVTDDKFWETGDHVRAAANAGYAGLIGKDMINMGECLADNVMWYQLNAWRQIGSGLYGSDLSTLNSRWSDSYTYIRGLVETVLPDRALAIPG
ncbi:MAG TPA: hypothetical protein VHO90_14360, partial [Bacteroidales bacterium]|nr:hypothetical protein [Bacteroidales bacterium]